MSPSMTTVGLKAQLTVGDVTGSLALGTTLNIVSNRVITMISVENGQVLLELLGSDATTWDEPTNPADQDYDVSGVEIPLLTPSIGTIGGKTRLRNSSGASAYVYLYRYWVID